MRAPHSIYGLADPGTGKFRYVGQTHRTLGARLYHHIWDAIHHSHKNRKDAWICNLMVRGLRPNIVLLEETSSWKTREKFWISQFPDLLNCTEGGEGIVGYRHTPEARQKIAAANKLRAGKKRTGEALANITRGNLSRRGRPQSAETIAKKVAALRGKKASPELCAKRKAMWATPERREQGRLNAQKRWDREEAEWRASYPESFTSLSTTQTN